jgi:hypothetical protein
MKSETVREKVATGRTKKTLVRLQTLIEPARQMARDALALHGCTEEQIEHEMKSDYTDSVVTLMLVKVNNYAERVAKGEKPPRY